jgi:hypothetical protein
MESIEDLEIEQQISIVKALTISMSANEAKEFVKDESVKMWIDKFHKEINASARIPKSHGGPG